MSQAKALDSLRAQVAEGGVSLAKAERRAMKLLGARSLEDASRAATRQEISGFLGGTSRFSAQEIAHSAAHRAEIQGAALPLGAPGAKENASLRELARLRDEVKGGADLQLAAGQALKTLGAEHFLRADRMRMSLEVGQYLKGEHAAPTPQRLLMNAQARGLAAKQGHRQGEGRRLGKA